MLLTIIIPVYNEEGTILSVLESLDKLRLSGVETEIIVINDGSSDRTSERLREAKKRYKRVKIFSHSKNSGKGAAIHTGIDQATGEYILIQDADLEYNPSDISVLLQPILQGKAEVVYGTRLNRLPNFSRDERTATFFMHYLGNRLLSLVTSILYGQWVTDMETGYKLLPKKFIKEIPLHARSFDFEPEITAKILKHGLSITEVPITTNPRSHDAGKKLVATKDGPVALWTLIKYRFVD